MRADSGAGPPSGVDLKAPQPVRSTAHAKSSAKLRHLRQVFECIAASMLQPTVFANNFAKVKNITHMCCIGLSNLCACSAGCEDYCWQTPNNNGLTSCNNTSIHTFGDQNSKAPLQGPCCFESYAVPRNRLACMQLRATGQALPQK